MKVRTRAERSAAAGRTLLGKLQELQQRHALIGDVRGLGLMAGVELVSDRGRKTPAADEAAAIQARLLEEGFLAGVGGYYGNVLRLQPPLVIEDVDLDRAVAALDRALVKAAR